MTCSLGQTHISLPLIGKSILVADDDRFATETIARKLQALGAVVTNSTTNEDALRRVHRLTPSFSIIDLELRGRETGALRQALYERHVPFAVYTDLYHRPRTGRWVNMPVIYKPDECGEIERTILRLSEKSRPWPTF